MQHTVKTKCVFASTRRAQYYTVPLISWSLISSSTPFRVFLLYIWSDCNVSHWVVGVSISSCIQWMFQHGLRCFSLFGCFLPLYLNQLNAILNVKLAINWFMLSCLNMQATSLPLVMYDQFCPFNILVQSPQDATEWGTILDNWGANTLRLLSLVGVSPCVLQSQYVCSFMFSVRDCSLARLTPHSWSWEWRQHATQTISRICWLSERSLFDVILGYFNQFSQWISALYQIWNSLKQVTHIYLLHFSSQSA